MAKISKKKGLALKLALGLALAGQGMMLGAPQAFAATATVTDDDIKIKDGWFDGTTLVNDAGVEYGGVTVKTEDISKTDGKPALTIDGAGQDVTAISSATKIEGKTININAYGAVGGIWTMFASDAGSENNTVNVWHAGVGWGGSVFDAGWKNTLNIKELTVSDQKYGGMVFKAGTINIGYPDNDASITTAGDGVSAKFSFDTSGAGDAGKVIVNQNSTHARATLEEVNSNTLEIREYTSLAKITNINNINFYVNSDFIGSDKEYMLKLTEWWDNDAEANKATGFSSASRNINVYENADFTFATDNVVNLLQTTHSGETIGDNYTLNVFKGVSTTEKYTSGTDYTKNTTDTTLGITFGSGTTPPEPSNPFKDKTHLKIVGGEFTTKPTDAEGEITAGVASWDLAGWGADGVVLSKISIDDKNNEKDFNNTTENKFAGDEISVGVGGGYIYGFDGDVENKTLNLTSDQSYGNISISKGTSTNGTINVYDIVSKDTAKDYGEIVAYEDKYAKITSTTAEPMVIGSATDTINIYNAGKDNTLQAARNVEFQAGKIIVGAGESGNFNVGALTGVGDNSSIEIKKDGISVGNFREADSVKLANDGEISAATVTIDGTTTAKSVNATTKLDVNKALIAGTISAGTIGIGASVTSDSITATGTVDINNIFTEKTIKAINAGTLNVNKASTLGAITAGTLNISEKTVADTVSGLTALNFIVKDRTPMDSTDAEGTYMLTLTGGTTGNSGISSYTGDVQVLVSADANFAINDVVRLINIETNNADDKLNIGVVKVYNGVSTITELSGKTAMDDIETNNDGKTLSIEYKAAPGAVVTTDYDEAKPAKPYLDSTGEVIKNNGWFAKDTLLVGDKGSGSPADVAIVKKITVNQGGEDVTVFKSSGELTGKTVIVDNGSTMGGNWKLFDSTNSHDNTATLTNAGAGWGGTVTVGDKNTLNIGTIVQTKDGETLHDGNVTYSAGTINVTGSIDVKNPINLSAANDVNVDATGTVKVNDITAKNVAIKSQITANDITATTLGISGGTVANSLNANTLEVKAATTAKTVSGVDTLNFYVANTDKASDTNKGYMLTLTGDGETASGISAYTGDVNVYKNADATTFDDKDVFNLIKIDNEIAADKIAVNEVKVYNGVSTVTSTTLKEDKTLGVQIGEEKNDPPAGGDDSMIIVGNADQATEVEGEADIVAVDASWYVADGNVLANAVLSEDKKSVELVNPAASWEGAKYDSTTPFTGSTIGISIGGGSISAFSGDVENKEFNVGVTGDAQAYAGLSITKDGTSTNSVMNIYNMLSPIEQDASYANLTNEDGTYKVKEAATVTASATDTINIINAGGDNTKKGARAVSFKAGTINVKGSDINVGSLLAGTGTVDIIGKNIEVGNRHGDDKAYAESNGIIQASTLNIHGTTLASGVDGVNALNFYVSDDNKASDYMLTLTGSYDADGKLNASGISNYTGDVNVYKNADNTTLNDKDVFNLIKVDNELEGDVIKVEDVKVYTGVSTEETVKSTMLKEDKTLGVEIGEDVPDGDGDLDIPEDPSNDDDVVIDPETGKPMEDEASVQEKINNYYEFISGTALEKATQVSGEVFTSATNHTDNLWHAEEGGEKVAVTVINSANDDAVGSKDIVGNSVKLDPEGTYSGIITMAGSIDGKADVGKVKNNIINLVGGIFKKGTIISAGKLDSSLFGISMSADVSDDNAGIINLTGGTYEEDTAFNADTLNVLNKDLSAGHLLGVKTLNFYAPKDIANGDTMLTLVDATPTTTNTTVNAYFHAESDLNDGDSITLLKTSHEDANVDSFEIGKSTWYKGISQELNVQTSKSEDKKSIVATINKSENNNPEKLREQTKSIVETSMATLATVNASVDLMTNVGYANAAQSIKNMKASDASAAGTFAPYAAIGYNNVRQNSGSYVNVKGYSINVGLAKEVSDNNGGKLLFGPFIEYGKSSYDSHLEDEFDTRGDGNSSAWGVGAMIRQDAPDGIYYEGSLRIGRAKSDFKSVNMIPDMTVTCEYETDNVYYGVHAGIGKMNKINDTTSIDTYAKLFYTNMQGDSAKLTSGETYKFDSVESIRSKLGFRYTKATSKNNSFYAGLAWQQEFKGSSVAHWNGMDTPSPSVKGATGVLELGVTLTGENSPLNIDLGLTGYAGKQRGCSVNAKFSWNF